MSNVIFKIFPNERFVDLTIYQYGWEECEPGHSYGPLARNHFLFHYVISGKGTLHSTDSRGETTIYQLGADKGFLICPNQINTYYADPDDPWEYTWLEIDGMKAKELFDFADLTFDHPIYTPRLTESGHEVRDEMLHIVHYEDQSPYYVISHLYLFFDCLLKSSGIQKKKRNVSLKDYYIKEALSFIEQNYQNNITIEDIASCLNLDRSYFGKLFKEALSKSPQDFLVNYRLTKSLELLKNTDKPIKDIGTAIGYPNQLHFSRMFKKEYGVSPREWRKTQTIAPY